MTSYRTYFCILFCLHFNAFSQVKNLEFIGFHSVLDSVTFTNQVSNNFIAADTLHLNVPSNEVWYVQKSILTQQFPPSSKGYIAYDGICNCITLDGMEIHHALNSEDHSLSYSSGQGTKPSVKNRSISDQGSLTSLYISSDYFSERLLLLPGEHIVLRNFVVSSSYSYNPLPLLVHNIFLEKYSITF